MQDDQVPAVGYPSRTITWEVDEEIARVADGPRELLAVGGDAAEAEDFAAEAVENSPDLIEQAGPVGAEQDLLDPLPLALAQLRRHVPHSSHVALQSRRPAWHPSRTAERPSQR